MISLKQAYEILFSQSLQLQIEEVNAFESLGRVLAKDILATINLPANLRFQMESQPKHC